MQNYKYKKLVNSKFNIKGTLSADGTTLEYINGDGEQKVIPILDCFKPFRGEFIDVSISTKDEMDLTDEFEVEDED